MRLLLDTHILLWTMFDEARVKAAIRDVIVDPANEVYISLVSLWEVVIKIRSGKLKADLGEVIGAAATQNFRLLAVATQHLHALADLPRHHSDPFDHLLIAQALADDLTFVSADRFAPAYPVRLLAA